MSTPILYLNNSSNWENHYSGSFAGGHAIVNGNDIYSPIMEATLPITFNHHIIAIYAGCSNSKPSWNFAGYCSQKIQTGLVVGGVPESLVSRQPIWLNQISLIFFPQVASTYALSVTPPKWFHDISIYTWQYIGEESDTTEVALSNMQTSLNLMELQLSQLSP